MSRMNQRPIDHPPGQRSDEEAASLNAEQHPIDHPPEQRLHRQHQTNQKAGY